MSISIPVQLTDGTKTVFWHMKIVTNLSRFSIRRPTQPSLTNVLWRPNNSPPNQVLSSKQQISIENTTEENICGFAKRKQLCVFEMARPVKILTFLLYLSFFALGISANIVRLIREDGFRGNSHFYHLGDGGHAWHFNTETGSSIYFKCVHADSLKCYGRAILRIGGTFRQSRGHNHRPNPHFVGERHFRQNILDQARGARFVDYENIVNEARRDRRYARKVRVNMTLARLRTSMQNARMKSYPPLPQTLTDLTRLLLNPNNARVSKTVDEEQNLYAGSTRANDGSHHIAFFSPRILRFMSQVKLIQGDGTFRARPLFPATSQCFVIITTWRNAVVPLGWFLMERKTLEAYRAIFRLLKHICPELNPETIISDWEYPQQKAWQEAFPDADIQGCLWHLCRAFIKKANKLRVMRFRHALPHLLDAIRRATVICLLPQLYFMDGLHIIKNEARATDIRVAFLLEPFFEYIEEKWINNDYRMDWMAMFNVAHRTNNACETHNRMLRKEVGAYRPNVYKFIDALAKLEHNANLDIQLMMQGGSPRRSRRWKSVYADRQLSALANDLEMDIFHDRNVAVRNFIHRAAHLHEGAFNEHVQREAGRN